MYNKNQPQIAQWNLAKLATAIYPLIGQVEPLQNAIGFFNQYYHGGWQTMMAEKLGLAAYKPGKEDFAKNDQTGPAANLAVPCFPVVHDIQNMVHSWLIKSQDFSF